MSAPIRTKIGTSAQGACTAEVGSASMAREATGSVIERRRGDGRVFALRFRAYGRRHYLTLGSERQGWTRHKAALELANVMADVRRGTWRPPGTATAAKAPPDPSFHEFASQWLESRRHEFAPRTAEDYELALTHHLLPFFAKHTLSEITAQEVDRYKALKVRERELALVERPLSNRTIKQDADSARSDPRPRGSLRADRPQPGEDQGREAEGGAAAACAPLRLAGPNTAASGRGQSRPSRHGDHGRRPTGLRADASALA